MYPQIIQNFLTCKIKSTREAIKITKIFVVNDFPFLEKGCTSLKKKKKKKKKKINMAVNLGCYIE